MSESMAVLSMALYNYLNTCSSEDAIEAYRLLLGEDEVYDAARKELANEEDD